MVDGSLVLQRSVSCYMGTLLIDSKCMRAKKEGNEVAHQGKSLPSPYVRKSHIQITAVTVTE